MTKLTPGPKNPENYEFDLKKIFWKFPLLISSYFASEESFLGFDQVFNPKLRGQHGAGLTSLEKDIVNNYSSLQQLLHRIALSSNLFNQLIALDILTSTLSR